MTDSTVSSSVDDDAPNPNPMVAATFKIAPYWPADPVIWFIQVEAQLAAHRISTQQTKFQHIVASLSPEYASEVRDILINLPSINPFDALKEALITRTQQSEQARLRELLSNEELGDKTPSRLLRKMQQLLAGKMLDKDLFRELFVQRMPPPVRVVLASTPATMSIEEIAQMADKIVEASGLVGINQVQDPIADIQKQIADLVSVVKTMQGDRTRPTTNFQRTFRPLRRRSSTSRQRRDSVATGNTGINESGICWYHEKYGPNSCQCIKPC